MANLNPKPEEVIGKVPEMRELFKKKYADNIANNVYDQRDIDRLMKDDDYACSFMRMTYVKGDPAKPIDQIDGCFKFRKEMEIWDLKDESFGPELWEKKAIYYKGVDKDNYPLLYVNVKENTAKGPEEILLTKKFIAHNFEKHHRANPNQMCVAIMDMTGAGITNLNMEMTKFIIACFTTHFPSFLAYMINYDMPFVLNATWKIISAFLNEAQRQKVLMVSKKDITKYINPEHLWDHMK